MKKHRQVITSYIQTKEITPEVVPALASLTDHLGERVGQYGNLKDVPEAEVAEMRNDMYLSTTSFKRLDKANALPEMSEEQKKVVKSSQSFRFILTIHSNLGQSCRCLSTRLGYDGRLETYCGDCW